MTTTKTTLSDAPSVAGDDGEAIPQTVESPTGSPVADTDGMSWYVACVRVNYEESQVARNGVGRTILQKMQDI